MLKGLALDHFYNSRLSQRTYQEACANIRDVFEGPGYHRRNLDLWNAITLSSVCKKNPEKSTSDCLQLLIQELRETQQGLSPDLSSNTTFLHNKLITACQGIPACRTAVSDPPNDMISFINKLRSSITTYEKEEELKQQQ